MMKKLLLCVSLMGVVQPHVHAEMEFDKILKGVFLLAGGAWAFERLRNSYNDWKSGNVEPATMKEDVHNVLASTVCMAMFAYVGGAKPETVKKIVGSGAVLGTVFVGGKAVLPSVKNMKLRDFTALVAVAGAGRAGFEKAGISVLSFTEK